MATYKYGSWVGAQQTGKITQRAYLGYNLTTNNATTYTVSAFMGADAWNTNWSNVRIDWTFGGTGYTTLSGQETGSTSSGGNIRCYPSSGGKTFTWSKGHSAVTKTITATTTLNHVDSDMGGSSVNGKKSTATYTFTIPAKTHYTVTFKPNGGTGGPTTQTKWYGETLTLSSSKPTRTNYTFKGWATSSTATTATYQPGSSYTSNSALTLYAVWAKIYVPAVLKVNASYRVSTQTGTITKNPEGAFLYVSVTYTCGYYKGGTASVGTNTLSIKVANESEGTDTIYSGSVSQTAGTSTTYTNSSSRKSFPYDKTKSYKLTVTLSNSVGTVIATGSVPSAKYPFELASTGEELALGVSTKFKDDMIVEIDELNAATKPIDKNLYDALVNIGWTGILS